MTRVNQVREERSRISSDDVVAVSSSSVLDQMEVEGLTVEESRVPKGVIPDQGGLNEPGGVMALRFLEQSARTALEETNAPRPLVSIPTADLISHTSFKSGSKFVIRIVPQPDGREKGSQGVEQILNDQKLYFDRASLQTTAEVHEEKFQIFESFDSETLFLFGTRPKIWNFQFIVANANRPTLPAALRPPVDGPEPPALRQARDAYMRRWNMDFTDELIRRYERYYRGSAALKMRARCFMSYEDILIESTLVGMVVSRNNTLTSAANVSITFVVHQRSFLGEDLTFGEDEALADLLSTTSQGRLVRERLRPSSFVPPRKSPEQLVAEYTQNQQRAQENQQTIQELQEEETQLATMRREAAAATAALMEEESLLAARVAATSDPAEKARLQVELKRTADKRKAAAAEAQNTSALSGRREEELRAAGGESERIIRNQLVGETAIRKSTNGDLVGSSMEIAYFVDILESDPNLFNIRMVTTYRAPDYSTASSIAAGADPTGRARLIGQVDVTDDPSYIDQPDGAWVRQEIDYRGAS